MMRSHSSNPNLILLQQQQGLDGSIPSSSSGSMQRVPSSSALLAHSASNLTLGMGLSYQSQMPESMDPQTLKMMELAEKKKRRLERNRASARQCRKRKKEKKMMLRQQLAHLEADNLQLRLKLQVGDENNGHNEKSAFITAKLNEMMKEGASETDIQRAIQELKERFSDYGRDRRSAIDFHIAQLRRCLQPTQTTRAILWLMSLAPKFHDPTTGQITVAENDELGMLWQSLLQTICPDPQQQRLMISYTSSDNGDPFHEIKKSTDECNRMLDRIVEIVCNKNDNLDYEMANIQSILSARQIAKFILWIDRNPACMQMLEALWPHLTASNQGSGSFDHTSSSSNINRSDYNYEHYHSTVSISQNNSVDNLSALGENDHDSDDDSSNSDD